eukprot:3090881-Pyramimonas_sp.AAC.1
MSDRGTETDTQTETQTLSKHTDTHKDEAYTYTQTHSRTDKHRHKNIESQTRRYADTQPCSSRPTKRTQTEDIHKNNFEDLARVADRVQSCRCFSRASLLVINQFL